MSYPETPDPPVDKDRAWTVHEAADGWYYYTDQGQPIGPFETDDQASVCLDDYEATYYD